jgi:DNA mismatch repair protein MLH1
MTQAKASVQDNIRTIYGSAIANELIPLTIPRDPVLHFDLSGYITNSNYHTKKTTFLLFINSTSPHFALMRLIKIVWLNQPR